MTWPISWAAGTRITVLGRYTDHYNVDRDILVYETEPDRQSYASSDYSTGSGLSPAARSWTSPERAKTCPAAMRRQGPGIPSVRRSLTRPEWEAATLETQG